MKAIITKSRFFTALTIIACLMAVLSSCGDRRALSKHKADKANKADSLIFDLGIHKEYKLMRDAADSLERVGDLSPLNANRWRGVSYYREGNYRMAEICYRKAMDCDILTEQDQVGYNKSARRLSELLLVKGDFEGSLLIAIPAVKKMQEAGIGSDIDYAILLNNIGCCQLNLGRDEEANESFLIAREHYANRWQTDSTSRGLQEAVIGTIYTSMAYINMRRYEESIYWIDRTEMLLDKYRSRHDARREYFDEYQGRIEIMRAVAKQGMGDPESAAQAYQAFLDTDYAGTGPGRINANEYLVAAQRFREAADNYQFLDQTLALWGMEESLDNIQLYYLPKYQANAQAGRPDSARVSAQHILAILDSVITLQKNSTTAEMATIYDTSRKDAQISQQQAEMERMRWISTMVALVLLTIIFTIHSLHRRKARRRLAETNRQLSLMNSQLTAANERAEESSKMKTNFIQQISHEIRTPLNILSGFTQIITTPGMELDEATHNDINRQINENTARITGLVNKMLELSDASSQSTIERNDNMPAIQIAVQAVDESHVAEAAHVTFDMQIAPEAETAMLLTNGQQATRALVLVLGNAVKFLSRPNAEVSEGSVTLTVGCADGYATFAVADTGIGVPPEEAEHIFEEFVQLDDYYDGTGIGLTVARSIARRLGGDLKLDTTYSSPARGEVAGGQQGGSGARFVLTLPL